MSSVTINGDTSGGISLTVPAVAGNNTATLPAATGTVMVSGAMPAFSAYQSSAQTLSSITATKIQFQTKEYDTNSNFDNTTNYRFTPTIAGYYQFSGGISTASSQTSISVVFYKNGSAFKQVTQLGLAGSGFGSALIFCNGSTDYVELYATIGVGQALIANASLTYFQAAMIRSN